MEISPRTSSKLYTLFFFSIAGLVLSMQFIFLMEHVLVFETIAAGVLIGLILGLLEVYIFKGRLEKISFTLAAFFRLVSYLAATIITIFAVMVVHYSIIKGMSLGETWELFVQFSRSKERIKYIAYFYSAGISAAVAVLWQINLLIGRGRLLKFISGRFHSPRPHNRFFMFLDLNYSTTIAEKIGMRKYARFIKRFIAAVNEAAIDTAADIFQYVGDEIVLIWTPEKAVRNSNALKIYFLLKDMINQTAEKYRKEFGVLPEFKAGLHYGQVIITEVGSYKKEIAYYGDTINTAARIRSICSELNAEFIISGSAAELFDINEKEYILHSVGKTALKGKEREVELYSVDKIEGEQHERLSEK